MAKSASGLASLKTRMLDSNALVLSSDRDPLDVQLRRTEALLTDLLKSSPSPKLKGYAQALAELKRQSAGGLAKSTVQSQTAARYELFLAASELQRKIAFANPLAEDFAKILFIEHGTGNNEGNGNYFVSQYFGHNGRKGGGLYILSNAFGTSPVKIDLLAGKTVEKGAMAGKSLAGGAFLSPDLSFDGTKVAFAWSPGVTGDISRTELMNPILWSNDTRYRIFVVDTNGAHLTQITGNAGDVNSDDFDPCWLPGDQRIVFNSTRRGGFGRCQQLFPHPTYTLHSMKADGSDLYCISWHETNEWQPSVSNDGMLLYTRWDYVDRHWHIAHHLWTCYPDGCDPRSWHGNYPLKGYTRSGLIDPEARPNAEYHCRSIPNSQKIIAIAGPHHGQAFGELVTIDPNIPDDGKGAQTKKVTNTGSLWNDETGNWGTPWPLASGYYLANYHRGIYLVDQFGTRQMLYNCTITADDNDHVNMVRALDPVPLRPRKLGSGQDFPRLSTSTFQGERASLAGHKPATISIVNVYNSDTPLPSSVKVKWLRIVELLPKSSWYADTPRVGYAGMFPSRLPIGIVPVESDGSVYCEAPVGKELFFQLLDAKGIAVSWMRSDTYVHPGENLSCAGCHEDKWKAVSPGNPIAFQRPPSPIVPEVSHGFFPFSFSRAVKPVFDAKCAPCHKQTRKGPDMSFKSLMPYVFHIEDWPTIFFWEAPGDPSRTPPLKFGTMASRLLFRPACNNNISLSADEIRRITLWMDINCPELGNDSAAAPQRAGKLVWPYGDVDSCNPLGTEVLVKDVTPPSTVPTFSADSGKYGSLCAAYLKWGPAVDNESGIGRYDIYRNDTLIDAALGTTFLDCNVLPSIRYTYSVVPVNRCGLKGVKKSIGVKIDTTRSLAGLGDTVPLAGTLGYTVDDTAISSITYSTGTVPAPAFRYLRYSGPIGSYCNIAEMEFYNGTVKLTGTAFGSSPASAAGSEFDKASDGSTSTFFNFSNANGGYTGIDLGAGNAAKISQIKYWPRSGSEGRMVGGKFQGSNDSGSAGGSAGGGPAGYNWCANENGSFTLPGTCDVAYGANGVFSYLYGQTGTIVFNNTTFGGDPISGTQKAGYYKPLSGIDYHTISAAPPAGQWSTVAIPGTMSEWTARNGTPGYAATEHNSSSPQASATFTFNGVGVQYYGYKRGDLGIVQISIDGAVKANVDCYSAGPEYNVALYEISGLTKGNHTIKVAATGTKNAASSGTGIIIDAFVFFKPDNIAAWLERNATESRPLFAIRILGQQLQLPVEFAGKPFAIDIFDLRGRVVQRIAMDGRCTPAPKSPGTVGHGIYIVKCRAANLSVTQRIVKSR